MLTANKGEWSEIYAIFKLLSDGQLYSGDADLKKIENIFYPIIKIIRTESGDVLCYHIYNRNQFEDYLFANTKLETASSTRHCFGKIYKENDKFYFKLNLQIRFK